VTELCLVEMDRLYYPSENMAPASRGSASSPVCWWRSAAWRRGAPGRRGTAAGAAAPVPSTAAARRRGPSPSPAWSTAPTSGWRGPRQRRPSRGPPPCCEYSEGRVDSRSWRSLKLTLMRMKTNPNGPHSLT